MWFDELNKRMQEGENRDYSPHPEKSWNEMEVLLEKHLPQEKKRRRFIFLLFPILLGLGIATYFVISRKAQPDKLPTTLNTGTKNSSPSPHATKEASTTPASPGAKEVDRVDLPEQLEKQYQSELNPVIETRPVVHYKNLKKPVEAKADNSTLAFTQPVASGNPINTGTPFHSPGQKPNPTPDPSSITSDLNQKINVDNSDKSTEKVIENSSNLITNEQPEPSDSAAITENVTPLKKSTSSFGEKFSVNFSAGPDISAVSVDRLGRMQLQYGIGLTYALNKNLVVRTGFYAGDKKYNADSASYKMPYPINNLEKVEADCFVYEIPLSLIYHFNQVKKHNWFLAGSVSSYIMKRETYGYYYNNNWGQSQYYDRTYKNENSHLFSVVGVSGGYRYHLSNQLTLLAEPYIKFPVSGIGVGKVKLNNAGVLFTVGYKPFSKKK